MACKSWYPCGTLRWRENPVGRAAARVGCRVVAGDWRGGLAGSGCGAAGGGGRVLVAARRRRYFSLGLVPVCKSGAGALTYGSRTVASSSAGQILVPTGPPGIRARVLVGEARRGVLAMMAPQEIDDEEYEQVLERVAAVDVAKGTGMVCTRVPHPSRPGKRQTRVWQVDADTGSVLELADHLASEGVAEVTLESTSDYWRIWFYVLEARGLDVQLVNARDVANVPGRPKSDKLDCVWQAKLTERGMLRPSFVPPAEIRRLRDYTRLRTDLTRERTRHWSRLEKLLEDALLTELI